MTTDESDAITAISHPAMNRVAFVLSVLGFMIASYLWSAHASGADIPCGGSGGCDKVASSPYSKFPAGSDIPVAAYGAAGYLILAALALTRTLAGNPSRDRTLLGLMVLGAAGGALFSLYLTYVELFLIHAVCRWCLASQTLILLIFVVVFRDWLRRRALSSPAESSSVENLSYEKQ